MFPGYIGVYCHQMTASTQGAPPLREDGRRDAEVTPRLGSLPAQSRAKKGEGRDSLSPRDGDGGGAGAHAISRTRKLLFLPPVGGVADPFRTARTALPTGGQNTWNYCRVVLRSTSSQCDTKKSYVIKNPFGTSRPPVYKTKPGRIKRFSYRKEKITRFAHFRWHRIFFCLEARYETEDRTISGERLLAQRETHPPNQQTTFPVSMPNFQGLLRVGSNLASQVGSGRVRGDPTRPVRV